MTPELLTSVTGHPEAVIKALKEWGESMNKFNIFYCIQCHNVGPQNCNHERAYKWYPREIGKLRTFIKYITETEDKQEAQEE